MIVRHNPRRPILLTEDEVQDVRRLAPADGDQLVLRSASGAETLLPAGLTALLLQALVDVADHRGAEIAMIPEVLQCADAAQLLGLRRIDLFRMHQEGLVPAAFIHEDGEPYFRRDDIFAYREEKARSRRRAFEALQAVDDELGITE